MTDTTDKNTANELKIVKARSNTVIKGIIGTFFVIALILTVKVLIDDDNETEKEQLAYANQYCKIIKPAGWTAETIGDSFIFTKRSEENPESFEAMMIMDVSPHKNNRYAPIDLNPVFVASKVKHVLEKYGFNSEELKIESVQEDKLYWFISAEDFTFSFKGYKGTGELCYSRDVKYTYIGVYPEKTKDKALIYIADTYQNYLKFPPPYNESDFERPIIDTRKEIDFLNLEKAGHMKLRLAKRYWEMRRLNASYTVKALENFNDAFKCFATASEEDIVMDDATTAMYKECQDIRDRQINQIKSEIMKYYHMDKLPEAQLKTEQLLNSLSVNSESNIREWAKATKTNLEELQNK